MAPEIILCIPFDTSVDTFSFGIIIIELILEQTAESAISKNDLTFERVIPGFGLNVERIESAASTKCPKSFLELALDCTQDDPSRRPSMKDVLKRLRKIELDESKYGQTNIGIFTGKLMLKFIQKIPT